MLEDEKIEKLRQVMFELTCDDYDPEGGSLQDYERFCRQEVEREISANKERGTLEELCEKWGVR